LKETGYEIYRNLGLQNLRLLVGWQPDTGKLGPNLIDYLNNELNTEQYAEIEPEGFAYLGGVHIENNVVQFPETIFKVSEKNKLLILKSNLPRYEHHTFLNLILDVAERAGEITEIYTFGGIASLISHTYTRSISTVANQLRFKEQLTSYGLETDMNYESAPEQRPSISSFLSWNAKRRNISAVNLWILIPFYLATLADPQAIKRTLSFLNQRFNLDLDFTNIDKEINNQEMKLTILREQKPVINRYLSMLERGIMLNDDESNELSEEIVNYLTMN